jgi:hypothetical protein
MRGDERMNEQLKKEILRAVRQLPGLDLETLACLIQNPVSDVELCVEAMVGEGALRRRGSGVLTVVECESSQPPVSARAMAPKVDAVLTAGRLLLKIAQQLPGQCRFNRTGPAAIEIHMPTGRSISLSWQQQLTGQLAVAGIASRAIPLSTRSGWDHLASQLADFLAGRSMAG